MPLDSRDAMSMTLFGVPADIATNMPGFVVAAMQREQALTDELIQLTEHLKTVRYLVNNSEFPHQKETMRHLMKMGETVVRMLGDDT